MPDVDVRKGSLRSRTSRRAWLRSVVGMALVSACCVQCHTGTPTADVAAAPLPTEYLATASVVSDVTDRNEQLARRDPLGFLAFCWEKYRNEVKDYRCTFTKQELIGGEILPRQAADVRFMEEPFSVDMTFTENVRECQRALYVAGAWVDAAGNAQAWAKPGGAILRAFVPRIKQPVHGARAQKASRRTIDQFGFGKSFELIDRYSRKAEAEGRLKLSYAGEGTVAGRPTYAFERVLPFEDDSTEYPDCLLIYHIDKETLLPTACYAYADDAGERFLGSYVYSDVQLNVGYSPDDFDPDKIDF